MPPGFEGIDELTMLCEQLPVLRRLNRGPVGVRARVVLEQAVAAAREGRPVGGYLEALGLGPVPEPVLQDSEVASPGEEQMRGVGPTLVESEPLFFSGIYVCPRGVCGRAEHRLPGGALPVCAIFGEALRFDEDA